MNPDERFTSNRYRAGHTPGDFYDGPVVRAADLVILWIMANHLNVNRRGEEHRR